MNIFLIACNFVPLKNPHVRPGILFFCNIFPILYFKHEPCSFFLFFILKQQDILFLLKKQNITEDQGPRPRPESIFFCFYYNPHRTKEANTNQKLKERPQCGPLERPGELSGHPRGKEICLEPSLNLVHF